MDLSDFYQRTTLDLRKDDSTYENNKIYQVTTSSLISYAIFPIMMMFIALIMNYFFYQNNSEEALKNSQVPWFIFQLFFSLTYIIPAYLYFNYISINKDVSIILDSESKSLIYSDANSKTVIQKNDLKICKIIFPSPRYANRSKNGVYKRYSRVQIKLKNENEFIITCLIIDPVKMFDFLKWDYYV